MENVELLVDLAFAMGAALLGGFAAHRLGQPVILGYLLAGVLIGPYTPGPVSSVERVQTLANLGVTLLMFALGVEFSIEALGRVRRVAVLGGVIEIALCIGLGALLGLALGYPLVSAVFLGGIIAISSSILILKLLSARDELESITGRVALGTGIVQDIAMVPLIVILPAMAGEVGLELLAGAGFAVLKGVAFLVAAYFLGTRLVPRLLAAIAGAGSRELFLLTIVGIAVGTAMIGHLVGISFALGAFVAGLLVAESEFSSQVLDEIIPVRDIFATLFFVAIGMLIDLNFLLEHALEVTLLIAVIIAGKLVIFSAVIRLFGYPAGTSMRAGLLLAQIGEFSFVMAGVGLARGAIDEGLYQLVLAGALITLILNPLLVNNAAGIGAVLGRLLSAVARRARASPRLRGFLDRPRSHAPPAGAERLENLKGHVIVCGYGRVGRELTRVLKRRGFAFVVIDYNSARVEEGRDAGCLAIQGDATNPSVLERAGLPAAKMLAVTLPDLVSAEQVVRLGRSASRRVRILARTGDARAIARLREAGADEVVQPEFEAGLEMLRQALRSYGVSSMETQAITGTRRQEHYSGPRPAGFEED